MNAYTAEKVGDIVVEEHDGRLGHEEVYVVVSGPRAVHRRRGDFDAPAGTIVFLPEPAVGALCDVAGGAGTTVLAVGGWRDKAFEPSGWE